MRTAYFAPGSSDELIPPSGVPNEALDAAWPMRHGVRQITIIRDYLIFDHECEHADMPVSANRNVPVPFSSYGQGEPKRLEGIQMAINRLISSFVTHHAYNAYPPEVVPQQIIDRMDKALQNARTKPGQRIAVPADLLRQLGNDLKKVITTVDIPTLPADFWKLLDLLLQLIDKEGNQADVTQGNASATWSGEAINSLQNAASQIIRGKSMFTEFYLKRIARLFVHSICNRLTPQDWHRYMSTYPVQAVEALHTRVKSLDVDIKVEITAASGASRQTETQNLVAAKQSGLPISDPTLMERLNLDPDAEQQKQNDWLRKQAMGTGGTVAAGNYPAANNPTASPSQQPGQALQPA